MSLTPRVWKTATPLVLLTLSIAACGSGATRSTETPPPTDTAPSVEILAEPDQVALAYQVEGGIAGQNFIQVELFGNGTGTVRVGEGEPQKVLVARSLVAGAIADLEARGIHNVDTTKQPDTGVADGTAVHITVHSVNGTSGVVWYGIGEAAELFDPAWVAISERAGTFVSPLASPVDADQGVAGNSVRGAFFIEGGEARICGALMESFPPQCGDPSTTLLNFDPNIIELESSGGVQWSDDLWTVYGRAADAGLDLS